jgi:benzylsuccinate CoA-transferase BbsF subunit
MEGMGISPSWVDPLTGSWEALIIQAALLQRSRTGGGLYVDLSMLESGIAIMGDVFLEVAVTGRLPAAGQSSGYSHAVPHGVYPCKEEDAWIAISVECQSEWEGLCQVLGDPSWCHADGLPTLAGRQRNRARIDRRLAEWTSRVPVLELFHRLQSAGVPAGPCYHFQQVVEDPHMESRGLFRRLPLTDGKTQITTGIPWRDDTDWKGHLLEAPALGDRNDQVFLGILGMPEEEYERFRREGILD